MSYELILRLSVFLGLFALFAGLEALAPRRVRAQARGGRWGTNLGLVVIDTLALRALSVLLPALAVGAALDAWQHGWGLFNHLTWPLGLELLLAVLILDLATKMRKTVVIDRYAFNECQIESAKKVIEAISVQWLQDKPKPQWIVRDSAHTFRSKEFREFCEDVGIGLAFPPEKEPWAHGEVERCVGTIKKTFTLLMKSLPNTEPEIILALPHGTGAWL